jgi:hypothetical protein
MSWRDPFGNIRAANLDAEVPARLPSRLLLVSFSSTISAKPIPFAPGLSDPPAYSAPRRDVPIATNV